MANAFSGRTISLIASIRTCLTGVIYNRTTLKIIEFAAASTKISDISIMFLNPFKFFFGDYHALKHTHRLRFSTVVEVGRYAEVW